MYFKSQTDDVPMVSKHVAVRILYKKVVFYGYLFIPIFIVPHTQWDA